MKCTFKICKQDIPTTRNRSAKYCSDECYYEAKKERSNNRYATMKAPAEELKRCERILLKFYEFYQLKKEITADDLRSQEFNFGISTEDRIDKNKRLFKVIGKYAYYIEPNKNVIICQVN